MQNKSAEPKRTLSYLGSFFSDADVDAANFSNKAVFAMERGDEVEVALRLIGSRDAEADFSKNNGVKDIISYGSLCVMLDAILIMKRHADAYTENPAGMAIVVALVFMVHYYTLALGAITVINGNASRKYRETKGGCEAWLEQRVGAEKVEGIKTFDKEKSGISVFAGLSYGKDSMKRVMENEQLSAPASCSHS